MYQYEGNHIEINSHSRDFEFDIDTVAECNGKYIVLLAPPRNGKDINNLYCLDGEANIVWQSEDLDMLYPDYKGKHRAYRNFLGVQDGLVYVSDFFSVSYRINLETGKVEGYRACRS